MLGLIYSIKENVFLHHESWNTPVCIDLHFKIIFFLLFLK